MAVPTNRQELIDYCLRQLGAPVLEINVAEEQVSDLVDDAIQYFQERHFDGIQKAYLKYQITEDDVNRGKARPPGAPPNSSGTVGIASTSATTNIVGTATTFTYYENSNYLKMPNDIMGVDKVFQYNPNGAGAGMWNVKYQYMLSGIQVWGGAGFDMLSYSMTMSYLETMNFLLNTHVAIRFNQRAERLYLDVDWANLRAGEFLIIDCWRGLDGNDYTKMWNDSFLKAYTTALIKKQWGQNLIKFQGVKLPGGIEFNGRQIFDDAIKELDEIKERMTYNYELPPMDIIG